MEFWVPFVLLAIVTSACAGTVFAATGLGQLMARVITVLIALTEVIVLAVWKFHGSHGRIAPAAWIAVIVVASLWAWDRRPSEA